MNLKQIKRLAKVCKGTSTEVLKYVQITPTHFIVTDGKILFKEKHNSPNPPSKAMYIHADQVAGLKGTLFIIHYETGSTDKGAIEVKLKTDVQYPDVEAVLKNAEKWDEKCHTVTLLGSTLLTLVNSLDKDKTYDFHMPKDNCRAIFVTSDDGEEILLLPCRKQGRK